jgi:hypothetical protein
MQFQESVYTLYTVDALRIFEASTGEFMKPSPGKTAVKARRGTRASGLRKAKPAAASTTAAAKPAAKVKAPKAAPKAAPKRKTPRKASTTAAKPSSKKTKTIRDSFNMPAEDYDLIGAMKTRALTAAFSVKKSELLRAGLRMLAALDDVAFKATIAAVPMVKTGRPAKKHKS